MVRKKVSSFSAVPAYLNLLNYLAKKFKVCKGKFLRMAIADFAHRFITADELDKKPLVRKWYVEVIEREILFDKRRRIVSKEVEKEENEILKMMSESKKRDKLTKKMIKRGDIVQP